MASEVARLLLRVADLDGAWGSARSTNEYLRGGIARALGLDEFDVPADDELIRMLTIRLHGDPGEDLDHDDRDTDAGARPRAESEGAAADRLP